MKCPYPNCHKDYNKNDWPPKYEGFVNRATCIAEEESLNRIYLISRKCKFCGQLFHEVYIGQAKYNTGSLPTRTPVLEFLASYPCSKTKFETKNVPKAIRESFNEAERCRSVGSLTGSAACLRKTIYALCDNKKTAGRDYREKIMNLPAKGKYKELLKQIKWLGDNVTKPGGEKYTLEMVDLALEILPILIDELYSKDERIETVSKILAKVRSQKKQDPTAPESAKLITKSL